jgi:uncharacterized protein (DUF697 family)/GTP-binding protein EngB required for normal cell division
MNQSPGMASDLATLLLCCGDNDLALLAQPLRRLSPKFGLHPVVQHVGHHLSSCPLLVAEFVEQLVATFSARPYGDVQADLAAAVLVAANVQLESTTSVPELEARVLRVMSDRAAKTDLEVLSFAVATLRRPFIQRAKFLGLEICASPLSLKGEKQVDNAGSNIDLENLSRLVQAHLGKMPLLSEFFSKVEEEKQKLGRVNILIAGKTGVGKSTLINAIFGENVATTGAGRPVTEEIKWYEPVGLPVRLCDTKGLELADFRKILADLESEIERSMASGKVEDRIHFLWLCVAEPSARVEEGEIQLVKLCARHGIPTIVVLTKALGPRSFGARVRELIPEARNVIRVLAEEWDDDPPRPRFGLPDLIRATSDLLPEATKSAFEAAQRVLLDRKRARALDTVRAAAASAALSAAVPIPVADAMAVLSVNVGMIVSVSAIMGVQMSRGNIQTIAGSMLGAMAVAGGGRLIAGEILKFIPGLGSVIGGFITSGVAGSATYGLGFGYVEFLCHFQAAEQRMPQGDEIKDGFHKFWQSWETKELSPPADDQVGPTSSGAN